MTAPAGPRLVRPDERPPPAGPGRREPARSRRILPLALAALLLVLAYAGYEARRAAALELRVGELSQSLRLAEAELAAQRAHLEAVRRGVAGVRERLDALQALADHGPQPVAPPAADAP
jgi:hypothetical protein